MSSEEEIKLLLKNAKTSIKEEKYPETLKITSKILKADSSNYTAFLYCAKAFICLNEELKALQALKKAVELKPEDIVPWHMFCKIYEKNQSSIENYHELMTAYEKLLDLEKDPVKWLVICDQVGDHTRRKNDQDTYINILQSFLKSPIPFKEQKVAEILSDLYLIQPSNTDSHLETFLEAFSISIFNLAEDREKRFKKIPTYLKVIYKFKELQNLVTACEEVLQVYFENLTSLEWISKAIVVSHISVPPINLEFVKNSSDHYINELMERRDLTLFLAFTAKAVELMKLKDYITARDDYLLPAVELKNADWQSWFVLARLHIILNCHDQAEHCMEQVYKRLNPTSPLKKTYNMDVHMAETLCMHSDDEKKRKGISLCHEILSETPNCMKVIVLLCRACIELENWDLYKEEIVKLKEIDSTQSIFIEALYCTKLKKFIEAKEFTSKYLSFDKENPEVWLLHGNILNSTENYQAAMKAYLKAALLAPNWYEPYFILGKYYQNVKKDLNTAKQCLMKAFELNQRSDDIGISLSDVLRELKLADENISLLETVTAFGARWAKLRLGLQFMENGDYQKSINHLRSAARSDPDDSHCWEALGDGYLKRGAHTASKKCYAKVVQLKPHFIYPKLQIARINQILGLAEESIEEFKTVLLLYPDCLPAMKGLAESCLLLIKKYLYSSGNLVKEIHNLCQNGIDALVSALILDNKMSCFWKLLGDLLVQLRYVPKQFQTVLLPSSIVDPGSSDPISSLGSLSEILPIALKAYYKAHTLLKGTLSSKISSMQESCLYYNIAYVLNLEANLNISKDKRKNALNCAKACVQLHPKSYTNWNLLGVIAASHDLQEYALAQHAFIKSIALERANPSAWTNLATMYLNMNYIEMANDCFKEALSVDPSYIIAWLGQATIAEAVENENSVKFLYHACTLGQHHNAIVSYAHCVLSSLQKANTNSHDLINKLYSEKHTGLPLASVLITSCHVKVETDPDCIANLKGCLYLWNKDFKAAINQFNVALELSSEKFKPQIKFNLILALMGDEQFPSALSHLMDLDNSKDFIYLCALAYSNFKDKQFEQSYKQYELALELCPPDNNHVQAELLFAMAANTFGAQDYETSKSILFQSLQKKVNFTTSLFALSALGILSQDLELSKATFGELETQNSSLDMATYVNPSTLMMIKCYIAFMEEKLDDIESYINEKARKLKSSSTVLISISKLLQQLSEHMKTSTHLKIALALAYTSTNVDVDLAILISYLHLGLGQTKLALRQLQLFINMFPSSIKLRALLAAAYNRQNFPIPEHCLSVTMEDNVEMTALSEWISQLNIK